MLNTVPDGGSQLGDISKDSFWGQLGFRTGDILRTVDGYPATPRGMIDAMHAQVGSDDRVTIYYERKGYLRVKIVEFRD